MLNEIFLKRIRKELGEDKYKLYLQCLCEKEKHGLSINLHKLKNANIDLDFIMAKFDAKLVYKNENFAYLTYNKLELEKKNIYPGKDPLYHTGLYYIQEPSAAKVLFKVEFNKNDAVIDLCASPGGKSCMALYNLDTISGGFLVSNEIKIDRAKTLSSNIERMGFENTIVSSNSGNELEEVFPDFFDKVMLDAPCSGEGMFRKSEEALSQWSEGLVNYCCSIQKELLENAYKMLKMGGLLIYSTCTFAKEEDEDNIEYFLNRHMDMKLIYMEKIYPFEGFGEGQFFAYIKKDGERKYLSSFPRLEQIRKLKILRYGIKLTDEVNKREIPSHAITHIDNQNVLKNSIELSDEEIIKYLHGEVIRKETGVEGFCRITYKNLGVGLAKVSGLNIKNHYPKGLRILY